ncbi:MAG: ABC transporter [Deltaproteobacteria bacterium HGW-Deltaproteobacteria-21]|jgi:ABC-2 type transport system permease protein|nr:MAG: ABC transporter [Deltaproteobacteria bacterium HGW-Deltaproteobacteria-21]PKN67872.1 MAG: ABC transporter [Deltaproteobacteria bacterium HGW-Deltaproteobacteria-15]
MHGLMAVYRKELADHFSSYRFVLIFALIAMVSFITSYMAAMHLREALEGGAKSQFVFLMLFNIPGALLSMVQFVAFFGPLIGIILGFDAINRERAQGTLVKVLSQPIYRDAVINGKFLAGATTVTIMIVSIVLVISGLGLILLGIVPGLEEIWRLFIYVVISVFYICFWLGLSILFSILFRGIATSALASVALWIFLSFLVSMGASVIADIRAPIDKRENTSTEVILKNAQTREIVTIFSPTELYMSASGTIIDPTRKTTKSLVAMGALEELSSSRFQNPLSLGQSILVVYPHMVALIAISLICFAISYTVFMVQEIRT